MSPHGKHEEFFEQGVEACNRLFGPGEVYICPLCARAFSRADLERRQLTLEHVPPASVGGTAICLTCRDCNSAGGYQADYALAELGRLRQMQAALRGHGPYSGKVRVDAGGVSLNATLRIDVNAVGIEVHEKRNDPSLFRAHMNHWRHQYRQSSEARPIEGLTFQLGAKFRFGRRPLFVSILRAGYLAAFAWFGYRYALDARLNVVRDQILRPDTLRLPNGAVNFVETDDLRERETLIAFASKPFEAVVVYLPPGTLNFGTSVSVVLPWLSGPENFYVALDESFAGTEGERRLDFQARLLGWPLGPAFTLDFA